MRILQVANFVAPTSGGIRTALAAWATEYVAAGYEVTALVPEAAEPVASWWPAHPDPRTVPGIAAAAPGYRVVVGRGSVLDVIRDVRPDVIELSDRTTLRWLGPWAQAAGIGCVLVAHEHVGDVVRAAGVPGPLARGVADSVNRTAGLDHHAVVAPSRYAAREVARHGAAVQVVPLAVDHTVFRPRPEPVAPWREDRTLALVHVGRLSREKDPMLSVATLAALVRRGVDAELTIVGDGPMRGAIARAAAALPVELVGHRAPHEVARLVGDSDVLLAPAPAETFGLAALEGLACGTPVVCAATGALPEVVGAGGRVAVRDADAFADAALCLARDPAARERARRHAVPFTWRASARRMLAIHAAVAERARTAAPDQAAR